MLKLSQRFSQEVKQITSRCYPWKTRITALSCPPHPASFRSIATAICNGSLQPSSVCLHWGIINIDEYMQMWFQKYKNPMQSSSGVLPGNKRTRSRVIHDRKSAPELSALLQGNTKEGFCHNLQGATPRGDGTCKGLSP